MLRNCFRSRVRHFINELPKSLDETYERILKEIPEENWRQVHRMLQCLVVAIRPLYVDEVAAILTSIPDVIEKEHPMFDENSQLEDQEQDLLSACPSLITIVGDYHSRVVQFSHFSVKEFLTSSRLAASSELEDISRYHILPDFAHTTFARISLGVLLRLDDSVDEQNALRIPLAEYAAHYWVSHAQVVNVASRVMDAMKTLFDSDKPHFAAWVRINDMDYSWSGPSIAKPLYFSALCGIYDLVEHLVKKHPQDVNAIGGRRDFPLLAALYGGHIQVAGLLLQHGADVSIQDTEQEAPLHKVIEWSSNVADDAIQFLLEHRADVNVRDRINATPLHRGSFFLDLESVRTLLDHGADFNAEDYLGQTPLHRALGDERYSDEQRLGVAKLLMERGADVNAPDKNHETPLHFASRHLSFTVAWTLLKHGADLNVKNEGGKIPFQLARESFRRRYEVYKTKAGYPREWRTDVVALMGLLYP